MGVILSSNAVMLRCGRSVRLTRTEIERFHWLTDIEPTGIRTLDDLDAYVQRCRAHYWGHSRDTRFLHWLIDREREKCEGGRSRG